MKFFITVVFIQLLMISAACYGGYLLITGIKAVPETEMKHQGKKFTLAIEPRFKPSEHESEAQHKFEASVKHTE